ncbi:hypothetical protein F4776DRAFT_638276 [Hypoxylon sp. NC0597]|nr:hypothetical protein F4776DRAFT_638276 [Hypoxylon sp. NC0597]
MASSGLPVALLIIYLTLSLPIIYIAIKHGLRHGAIISWFFLFAFCTLRIVSSAIELHDAQSSSAALVASIGLSPLLAAACGIHVPPRRAYLIPKSRRPFDTPYMIFFHLLVTTAIALVAAGASKLSDTSLPSDRMRRSQGLVKGGMVMLLLGWISLAMVTLVTGIATVQHSSTRASTKIADNSGGKKLLIAVAFSIPFLGIRVMERLVYFFTENPDLNPVTGSLGLRVGLEVVEELIVTSSFIFAGIVTRNIGTTTAVDQF